MNYFCFKPDGRYKSTPLITCYFLKRFSDIYDYDSSDKYFVPKCPNLCICIYNLDFCRNGQICVFVFIILICAETASLCAETASLSAETASLCAETATIGFKRCRNGNF